jgi:hypothetical protein
MEICILEAVIRELWKEATVGSGIGRRIIRQK